jgi:hypothetical protein
MARFTTRVELHEATEDDYANLHVAMEREGFSRTISGDDGVVHLPPAEYNRIGELTRDQIMDSAKRAAKTTNKTFSLLVTEGTRSWFNLEAVR